VVRPLKKNFFVCVLPYLDSFFLRERGAGGGMAVLKNSLDKMIKLLLPKIQFTEKTNLHIYLASNFTNVHNNIQLVLRRLYRHVVLQFLYPPCKNVSNTRSGEVWSLLSPVNL